MKQNEQGKKGLSRRAFLGLGGTALAGAAVVGMAGCAPQAKSESAAGEVAAVQGKNGATAGPDAAGIHSWEIAPEAIPADKIKSTEECDVLVIGAGLGGCCSSIAALEEGAGKVIVTDKNPETVVARGVHIAGFHTKVQQDLTGKGLLTEPDYSQVVRRWINWRKVALKSRCCGSLPTRVERASIGSTA